MRINLVKFTKMAAVVLKDLGLGNKPYEQNIPESVNNIMKDWMKYIPLEMDRLIVNLYDFVQKFYQEEEMPLFQLSNKWEVCHHFQQHLRSKSHAEMTQEERQVFFTKVSIIWPDPEAYKRCCNFKIQPFCSSCILMSKFCAKLQLKTSGTKDALIKRLSPYKKMPWLNKWITLIDKKF